MKKFVISSIIIILVGLAVFFIGWIQFSIPIDNYGVLVSKTSGTHPEVFQNGSFIWRWERLIPFNTKIKTFSSKDTTYYTEISGELPSAEIYSSMLEGNPDFTYSFSVKTKLGVDPSTLPTLVNQANLSEQEDLDEWLQNQNENVSRLAIKYVLDKGLANPEEFVNTTIASEEICQYVNDTKPISGLVINGIHINNISIPDLYVYNLAKETYISYENKVKTHIESVTEKQALQASEDYLEIERFNKLGKTLTEYPILLDFLKVSKDGKVSITLPSTPEVVQ